MRDRTKKTLTITMENLTEAQVIALHDLFATWQSLGGVGSSRWTSFYADGDGDFRPKIKIDGEKPKFTDLLDRKKLWAGDEYRMDFDGIGWALSAIDERENSCTEEKPDRTKKYHDWSNTRAHGHVCKNCGVDWEVIHPKPAPTDWTQPHHFMAPEGWNSRLCPDCGKDYNDPVHLINESTPETAERHDLRFNDGMNGE